MKTNQNMMRKMGDFEVVQRTKDGMFNATILLKQWNEKLGVKKEVSKFFELKQTSDFIEVLEQEENLNTQETAYLKTRGKYGGTWMHKITSRYLCDKGRGSGLFYNHFFKKISLIFNITNI